MATTNNSAASVSPSRPGWPPASAAVFLFSCFLLATTPWLGWDGGIQRVTGDDVRIYERIASAAPAILGDQTAMQHRSRFLAPYIVGLISRYSGLEQRAVFVAAAAVFLLLLLAVFHAILKTLKVRSETLIMCMGLYVLSPYALRFYLILPGMLPDLVFLLGLVLALLGMLRGPYGLVFLGCVLAAVGRQTVLVMLPGILVGVVWGAHWRARSLGQRLAAAAALLGGVAFVYKILALLGGGSSASGAGGGNIHFLVKYAFSILPWLAGSDFRTGLLVEHIAKTLIPLAMLGAVGVAALLRERKPWSGSGDFWACLTLVAGIAFFPLFTSPVFAAGGQCRYTAYALIPAITALALFLGQAKPFFPERGDWRLAVFCGLLALGSLHHLNSSLGPATALQFTVFHLVVALGTGAVLVWPSSHYFAR